MSAKQLAEVIRKHSDECFKSASDLRNAPNNRDTFQVVAVAFAALADDLEKQKDE